MSQAADSENNCRLRRSIFRCGNRVCPQLHTSEVRLEYWTPFLLTFVIAIVILAKLMDLVVLVKLAIVAIFPNVAAAGIEEGVVTAAIGELDTDVLSFGHGRLGLKDWFQDDYRK